MINVLSCPRPAFERERVALYILIRLHGVVLVWLAHGCGGGQYVVDAVEDGVVVLVIFVTRVALSSSCSVKTACGTVASRMSLWLGKIRKSSLPEESFPWFECRSSCRH